MKTAKIILLVLIAVFVSSSFNFCGELNVSDVEHHCLIDCDGGDYTFLTRNGSSLAALPVVSTISLLSGTFYQSLFVNDISRPPNTSC